LFLAKQLALIYLPLVVSDLAESLKHTNQATLTPAIPAGASAMEILITKAIMQKTAQEVKA
jgi:hypothetical protein